MSRVSAHQQGLATRPWRHPGSGPAVSELRRVLARSVAGYQAVVGGLTLVAAPANLPDARATTLCVLAALLLLAAGIAVLRDRPVLVVTLAIAASVAAEFSSDPTSDVAPGSATYAVLGIGLIALTQFRAPYAALATAVAIALYVAFGLPDLGAVLYRVDMQALTIGCTAAGIGFISMLFASARATDAESDRTRLERIASEAAQAQTQALNEVQRVIHDDVVGALAVIGAGRLDPEDARTRAQQALDRLSTIGTMGERDDGHGDAAGSWPQIVRRILEGVELSVVVDHPEAAAGVPADQIGAIIDASREALRNVARHAGVEEATWRAQVESGRVVVTIADRGCGIGEASPGLGLRVSVMARLAEVGGSAHIDSDASGTRVVLTLPIARSRLSLQHDLSGAYRATMKVAGAEQAHLMALRVAIPMLIANSWVGVRHGLVDRATLWELPLWLAMVGTTIVFGLSLRRREPHPVVYVAISLGVALDTYLGLQVAGEGATVDFRSWMVLGNVICIILLAYVTPLRWAPLYVLPDLAVVAYVAISDPTVAFLATAGALITPLAPLPAGILGHLQRRADARLEEEHTRFVDAQVARASAARIRDVQRAQLATTMREALPFLEELALGTHVADDMTIRRRAGSVAGAVRDDLYAPGVIDRGLRRPAAELRGRGGHLVVRPDVDVTAVRADFDSLLALLLPMVPEDSTVTISQGQHDDVRVVVVPPLVLELPVGHRISATHGVHRSEFVLAVPHLSGDGAARVDEIESLT